MSFDSSVLFPNSSNQLGVVGYLDTHENLNILMKLNKKAKDVTIHCALWSMYRKGIIHRINSRPNQSNKVIHSEK